MRAKLRSALSWTLSTLAAVVGILGFLMTLYPRLTVMTSGPSDDKNPLSASFTISNDGYLPAYSVVAQCMVGEISMGRPFTGGGTLVPIGSPQWKEPRLYPGAKMAIPFSNCFIVPNEVLTGAHVGLLVTYRPLLWPFKRQLITVYTARSIGNGHFYWYTGPN
jgi:hypothetical protein